MKDNSFMFFSYFVSLLLLSKMLEYTYGNPTDTLFFVSIGFLFLTALNEWRSFYESNKSKRNNKRKR
jgi:hypothetical protein